ncbi:hypothetical protein ASD76_02400 [Altererythrobacter sp. Root672]|nr:hypothetical protein ASD76_02400 [Altererythrobacter sp. Root672]
MPMPNDRTTRTVLFALRRMAVHGVRDANACWLMLDLFSTGFRRPLVLLRAFMLELSHASRGPIQVAPCCTPRMTEDESLILRILFGAANDLAAAEDLLVDLTRNPGVAEPLSAAAVFGRCLTAAKLPNAV